MNTCRAMSEPNKANKLVKKVLSLKLHLVPDHIKKDVIKQYLKIKDFVYLDKFTSL